MSGPRSQLGAGSGDLVAPTTLRTLAVGYFWSPTSLRAPQLAVSRELEEPRPSAWPVPGQQ